jgi:glycosyltransferase involved in cell wall biosynthesis
MPQYASTRSLRQLVLHSQPHIVISATPELSVPLGRAFPSRARPFAWLVREGNNTRLKILDTATSRLDGWLQTRLIKKTYRKADRIVTPSNELSRMLAKLLAVPVHQVTTIPNPIDVAGVLAKARQPLLINWPKGPTVVTSARLIYQKGIDVLIRAMALVCHPCHLVVVGRGEIGQYQCLAKALGIESRIVFAGMHTNPFPLIKRADIYVQPSRWEGFCSAISEAMACGVPVIASNCDFGPREQIEQGCNGTLVPPESPLALAEAIDHLLEEPNYAKKLAQKAEQNLTARTVEDAVCRYRREMELAFSAYHYRMRPQPEIRHKESLF